MVPGRGHALSAIARDPRRLEHGVFDLAVVGGGIYGACAAYEGARAGLRVALVEQADFGHATSWNSLRTLHGGIRYLQHLDIGRLRDSVRERRFWMRFAPELTEPMPFVLPTSGSGLQGPAAMAAGGLLFDILSADRNQGVPAGKRLGSCRVVGRSDAARWLAPVRLGSANGAMIWHEAIATDTERLLLKVLQESVGLGALALNYCAAVDRWTESEDLHALRIVDRLTGQEHRLITRVVLNATGPCADQVCETLRLPVKTAVQWPSRAFNLLTRIRTGRSHAVGLPVRRTRHDPDARIDRGANTYFLLPWSGHTLIGTKHLPASGGGVHAPITRGEVLDFIRELNGAAGSEILTASDVVAVLSGVVPASTPTRDSTASGGEVQLLKRHRIVDHGREHGVQGVFTVVGVKWTTARSVAQKTLRAVLRAFPPAHPPLGGPPLDTVVSQVRESAAEPLVRDLPLTAADVLRAVRFESAVRLDDLVFRRTRLWLSTQLTGAVLDRCAQLMRTQLGWDDGRLRREVSETGARLDAMRFPQ